MRLSSITVNKEVVSIDTGDFNGDGKPDLVFYGTPAEVTILFNDGKAGIRRVQEDQYRRPGAEDRRLWRSATLDQDGRDDLALLGDKELIFIYQTATGVLSEPERAPHTAGSSVADQGASTSTATRPRTS